MLEGNRSKVGKIKFNGNEDNVPNQPSFNVSNSFLKLSLDYFSHEQITSQNPYAEVFVGEPFVQTVNINNMNEVEEALQKILNSSVGNRCFNPCTPRSHQSLPLRKVSNFV